MTSWRTAYTKTPATRTIDDTLVDFVLEALGCANEPPSCVPAVDAPELDRTPHTASSAERSRVVTSRVETASCTVTIEWTESFFPGDVNEPPRETDAVRVEGVCDRTRIKMRARVGDDALTIEIEAGLEKQERIVELFTRRFG